MRRLIALFPLLLLGWQDAEKKPLPPDAEVGTARVKVRALLGIEYAKAKNDALVGFADKLLKLATDEQVPAMRYAVLLESMKTASLAGDITRTVHAAQAIERQFDDPNLKATLGEFLAVAAGVKDQPKEFQILAGGELAGPTDPKDQVEVAKHWLEVAGKLKVEQQGPSLWRSRTWLLTAAASKELQGLARIEAEKLAAETSTKIEASDAKTGRFTLYAGKWTVVYENRYTREYVISEDGALAWDKGTNPEGKPFVAKEEQRAKLQRRAGAVLAPLAGGTILEKFSVDGDKLQVERFHPASHYPKTVDNKATGVRAK